MSAHNTDVVPGNCLPVLGPALLLRTRELNLDYVRLLLAERAPSSESLSDKVLDGLSQLSAAARGALAACSYTLFSLGFDDIRFWSAALAGGSTDDPGDRYGDDSVPSMQGAFCEVALFFAWHVSQANPLAARVLFAMPGAIEEQLAAAPLWQLRRVALDYPGLLVPRWPHNPAFWPDLVRFAASSDPRLLTAQLLGHQLIASELDGSLVRGARPRLSLRRRRQDAPRA